MLYYNTVSNIMRIYSGSAWENVAVSTAGFTTLTGVETLTNKTLTAPKIANGGFVADANGNEQIKFTTTASAVNELTVVNSATSNAPEISSTGGDTDIDLKITPKGSGNVVLDGLKYPNADGTVDQVLKTDGSGNLSFTDVSGGISWQSSIVTGSTLSAVAGNGYWINTTSNACTITLPGSASVGDQLIFTDYARTWGTNKIIIDSNGLNYQGDPDTLTVEYNTNGQSLNIVYSGATKGWIPISDDDVTDAPIVPPYSIDFLVVAGGGSGGCYNAGGSNYGNGGGGAGGFRTSTQTASLATVITVTVGDGGAATTGGAKNNGSNSSISGSGLTTITSTGGGSGGSEDAPSGNNGGSGGGASSVAGTAEPGGSGNTPSTSPSQGSAGGNAPGGANGSGGGGGANAVGGIGIGTDPFGGLGGNGTASSITGSSVTYAGGGGGASSNAPGSAGGSGGGGSGGTYSPNANGVAGTANTGGGGGGGSWNSNRTGGAGGKGVVILSFPTANYSSTTTGSPTVTTSGVNTILQFNGDGSYTA
jgi:hypothetical protein